MEKIMKKVMDGIDEDYGEICIECLANRCVFSVKANTIIREFLNSRIFKIFMSNETAMLLKKKLK